MKVNSIRNACKFHASYLPDPGSIFFVLAHQQFTNSCIERSDDLLHIMVFNLWSRQSISCPDKQNRVKTVLVEKLMVVDYVLFF